MNRKQIEAEFDNFPSTLPNGNPWTCVDFAQHIAKLEREDCAKLCENLVIFHVGSADKTLDQCAEAIRARGNE